MYMEVIYKETSIYASQVYLRACCLVSSSIIAIGTMLYAVADIISTYIVYITLPMVCLQNIFKKKYQ